MNSIIKKTLCFGIIALIVLVANQASATTPNTPGSKSKQTFYLSIPGENWALALDMAGYKEEETDYNKDGRGSRILASNKTTGVIMSVYLTKEGETGDSKKCRDFYWKRFNRNNSGPKPEQVTMREAGNMAILDYRIKLSFMGDVVYQQHSNAFMAFGDTYIHIHLSKVAFQPGDQQLFDDFLAKVTIKEDYQPSIDDYFCFGLKFFIHNNYELAITYLEKTLELEKIEHRIIKIDKCFWQILIRDLEMSYYATGKFTKAQEILEYGIANDPEYAIFYYDRACIYAALNDMDKTLDNLRLAFRYKDKLPSDQKLSNPQTESEFKEFRKNPKFKAELEQITK